MRQIWETVQKNVTRCVPEGWPHDDGSGGVSGTICEWWLRISTTTHPGASECIRRGSEDRSKASQQFCYVQNEDLITGGVGAGGPDRNDRTHHASDLAPWLCAAELDGNPGVIQDGPHMREYLARRPANNGNGCTTNIK